MDTATKLRLKNIPRKICDKCRSKQSYTNPIKKCEECGKRFCFDHISRLYSPKRMKENDELKMVCENCEVRYGYRQIS